MPSYANATSGALYSGVAGTTSTPLFSTLTPSPAPQREHAAPVVPPAAMPLSMSAGICLFIAGGAISGYDWLRSRRRPAPAQAELDAELLDTDPLDADLVDAEPER
ncbi:MAG: hypothetical protein ABIV47_26970 [Roseiflexaceae bacterium]